MRPLGLSHIFPARQSAELGPGLVGLSLNLVLDEIGSEDESGEECATGAKERVRRKDLLRRGDGPLADLCANTHVRERRRERPGVVPVVAPLAVYVDVVSVVLRLDPLHLSFLPHPFAVRPGSAMAAVPNARRP